MAPGEHPAEGAEDRTLAPAVVGATALDGSHALHEPACHSDEQVDPGQRHQSPLQLIASRPCPRTWTASKHVKRRTCSLTPTNVLASTPSARPTSAQL
jgi:hypothetical protein